MTWQKPQLHSSAAGQVTEKKLSVNNIMFWRNVSPLVSAWNMCYFPQSEDNLWLTEPRRCWLHRANVSTKSSPALPTGVQAMLSGCILYFNSSENKRFRMRGLAVINTSWEPSAKRKKIYYTISEPLPALLLAFQQLSIKAEHWENKKTNKRHKHLQSIAICFVMWQQKRQWQMCQKMVKNAHHKFLKPKMMSSNFLFSSTNSPKPKDISFTIIDD